MFKIDKKIVLVTIPVDFKNLHSHIKLIILIEQRGAGLRGGGFGGLFFLGMLTLKRPL